MCAIAYIVCIFMLHPGFKRNLFINNIGILLINLHKINLFIDKIFDMCSFGFKFAQQNRKCFFRFPVNK